ncbi:hypothetical protein [Nonomuraea fuscirosea]|uniref:hypothetical protein n=1 Tax=Nonomuraea fuscirosea TaxID=1291556 RepID=UPI0033D215A1
MAIVVLHLGGGASLVGGCGLVRRVLRAVDGPRSRRRSGPAPTPHARPAERVAGRAAAASAAALDPYKNNSANRLTMAPGAAIKVEREQSFEHPARPLEATVPSPALLA